MHEDKEFSLLWRGESNKELKTLNISGSEKGCWGVHVHKHVWPFLAHLVADVSFLITFSPAVHINPQQWCSE